MSLYEKLRPHRGHAIVVVGYGEEPDGPTPDNVAVECIDCGEVLVSVDADGNNPEEAP